MEDSEKAVRTMDEVKLVMADQNENVGLTRGRFEEMHGGVEKTIAGIRSIAGKMEKIDNTRAGVVEIVQNLTALAQENGGDAGGICLCDGNGRAYVPHRSKFGRAAEYSGWHAVRGGGFCPLKRIRNFT